MTTNMKTRGLHHSTLKWLLKSNEVVQQLQPWQKNDVLNISLHYCSKSATMKSQMLFWPLFSLVEKQSREAEAARSDSINLPRHDMFVAMFSFTLTSFSAWLWLLTRVVHVHFFKAKELYIYKSEVHYYYYYYYSRAFLV